MGDIHELADRYVDELAALHPTAATFIGVTGHDHELTDLSPDGFAALADHHRRTLAELTALAPADESERVAKEAMLERLALELERYEAGETTSELNVLTSGLHDARMVFDLMPTGGRGGCGQHRRPAGGRSRGLRQYQRTLLEAAASRPRHRPRQMAAVAEQCDVWADPARRTTSGRSSPAA